MKKKLFCCMVMISMCTLSFGGTVNYYNGSGGYINKPLDNDFVGNDPTIARWAVGSNVWFVLS